MTTDTPASALDLPALLAAAEAALPDILPIRRRIHRRPEIGLQLPRTQATIVDELRRLGLEPRLGTATTSVTALIEGDRPGPTTLLRGDMDALPVAEDTGLEFASEVEGAMHACGHDTHVAMLLGAARLLVERRHELAGRALLMFQPGEEGYHGARIMLDEGLLDDAGPERPSRSLAIHIGTRYPAGVIRVKGGPIQASMDELRIVVRGRGGHASTAHLALDPIPVAATIVTALQTMVTRRVDVWDPVVVTVAHIRAGTTHNIIPEFATLHGTIRTVSAHNRERVPDLIRQVATGVAEAHGATAEVEIVEGYPVTVNDEAVAARVRQLAIGLVGEEQFRELDHPIMGAEDFSYILERVPGAMVFLGARPEGQDPLTAPQNHSNRVVFDEAALPVGIALYAAAALDPR
jgi:amidohydrolase